VRVVQQFVFLTSYYVDLAPEADLGMFTMFGRTGAPTKSGPHRP